MFPEAFTHKQLIFKRPTLPIAETLGRIIPINSKGISDTYSADLLKLSPQDWAQQINNDWQTGKRYTWAIFEKEHPEAPIGVTDIAEVEITAENRSAWLSTWLDKNKRGQGLGRLAREATTLLCDKEGIETFLHIDQNNKASIGVAKRLGYHNYNDPSGPDDPETYYRACQKGIDCEPIRPLMEP